MEYQPTYWENIVWVNFNPSQKQEVTDIKALAARFIDVMNDLRTTTENPEVKRLTSIAITEAETACMYAVKAITK